MSLVKTLTFDELWARNDRALERAGYDPSIQVTVLRVKKRRRIQKLLEDRRKIDALASTEDQREAYGRERWDREFVRLRDVARDPHVTLDGEALRWHVWSRVPNCRFKRFQELFSDPADFIVPPFAFDARGNVSFGSIYMSDLSLRPCLVHADRIPEKLLEDLGLCDFTKENGDPLARLKKKRAATARLKFLFEAAAPMQRRHERLLVVREPSDDLRRAYSGIEGPPATALGTIVYVREQENGQEPKRRDPRKPGPRPPRALVAQHFASVYAAHRKTLHESGIYEAEVQDLTGVTQDLTTMNRTLDQEWKATDRRATVREQAQTVLRGSRRPLEHAQDAHKAQAHDLLADAESLSDARGKENVTATMSKMVAAKNRLGCRLDEMCAKGGFNQQDRFTLERHIGEHEAAMERFRAAVLRGGPRLFDDSPLFRSDALAPDQIDAEACALRVRMGIYTHALDKLFLEPFRTHAEKLREKCNALDGALRDRSRDRAADTIVQMHVIGKFQAVRTCFERVRAYVTASRAIPVQEVRAFVQQLLALFAPRQLFEERTIEGYREPFEKMLSDLQIIERGLAHYAGKDLAVRERSELYGRLKEYLDRFAIEAIVRALP